MTGSPSRLTRAALLVATLAAGVLSCADPSGPDTAAPSFTKGGNGGGKPSSTTTVTATDPSFGHEGDQSKRVTITGTGFEPDAKAEWQRGGVADPKIQVLSTEYVSSTELNATISIAADADLGFYDVAVTYTGRKGGVGTDLFEVTTAFPIEGGARAYDVNDAGRVAGAGSDGSPFVYDIPTGVFQTIGPTGFDGMAISQDGLTVAGSHNKSRDGDLAVVWTKDASGWTQTSLPRDPAARGSGADAIASDPITGQAQLIAGWEFFATGHGKTASAYMAPRVWVRSAAGWDERVLPTDPNGPQGVAWDVGSSGVVVGASNLQPAVWDPDGAGGYTLTLLLKAKGEVEAINDAGTFAVGRDQVSGRSYWFRSSTLAPWVGPMPLPGCSANGGSAVDDVGHWVGNCVKAKSLSGAVLVPPLPYTSSSILYLGGLGTGVGGGPVNISPNGTWIVGVAGGTGGGTPGGTLYAIYWNRFWP